MHDELEHRRRIIESEGASTLTVDNLVLAISNANDTESVEGLFDEFEKVADELPWAFDRDYAAVALQAAIPAVTVKVVQRQMLLVALYRAERCAGCATSGAEGSGRMAHVNELRSWLARMDNHASGE